ncbi:SDR family oxidoreductase [Maribacter sp. X9]|uniref:SDR family oxidoreductase n=1 Tax=Maribacter sp. X9 TaxID=3402159 RepID=UPI003AF37C99
MKKTLITGATGSLGGAVAKFLKEKGSVEQIAVLVRDTESDTAKALAKQGFELRVADYNNSDALSEAFKGIEVLYFVSGSDIGSRVPQHKNVVKAAENSSIEHIFYTSVSLNGLSKEAPLYNAMAIHLDTEQWIKDARLTYTFLRHNLYSEVIAMFLGDKKQVLGSKTVYLPTGTGKTAFVPRIELAEIGANVLADPEQHANKTYELNGSHKITFGEIATELSNITGEPIAYVSPEVEVFEKTMQGYGVPAEYIGMMSSFGQGIADGVFDSPSSDLESLLGRTSQPVPEFLKEVYS